MDDFHRCVAEWYKFYKYVFILLLWFLFLVSVVTILINCHTLIYSGDLSVDQNRLFLLYSGSQILGFSSRNPKTSKNERNLYTNERKQYEMSKHLFSLARICFFFMFMYGITKVCDKIKYLFLFEKIKPRESNNKYAKVGYVKDQIRIETCLYGSK